MNLSDKLLNHMTNETQLRILIDLIPEYIVLKDGYGRWLVSNKTVLDVYGLHGYDYTGKTDMELAQISPQFIEPFKYNMTTDEMAWRKGSSLQIEKSFPGVDGMLHIWEVVKTPIFDDAGNRHRMVIVSRNITERKKTEKALQISEMKYRLIAENMHDIIATFAADGTMQYVSPSFEHILGYSSVNYIGKNIIQVIHPDDRATVIKSFSELIEKMMVQTKVEFRCQHADGRYLWFEAHFTCVFREDGKLDHVVGAVRDIMERKEYELRLQMMAYHDPLTEIPNRRFFMDQLMKEMAAADRRKSSLALLYLDVDHFKEINDTFGHDIGDELLVHFVKRVKKSLRLTDTIARLGGDEFVIILPDIPSREQAAFIAERLCASLQQPWELKKYECITSSSIGVALYPQNGTTVQALLSHADQALYKAKRDGRRQVRFFESL
jgi:diguanylate cyclase (GGDEF)-like protein/PAS domain S-box-containing protein